MLQVAGRPAGEQVDAAVGVADRGRRHRHPQARRDRRVGGHHPGAGPQRRAAHVLGHRAAGRGPAGQPDAEQPAAPVAVPVPAQHGDPLHGAGRREALSQPGHAQRCRPGRVRVAGQVVRVGLGRQVGEPWVGHRPAAVAGAELGEDRRTGVRADLPGGLRHGEQHRRRLQVGHRPARVEPPAAVDLALRRVAQVIAGRRRAARPLEGRVRPGRYRLHPQRRRRPRRRHLPPEHSGDVRVDAERVDREQRGVAGADPGDRALVAAGRAVRQVEPQLRHALEYQRPRPGGERRRAPAGTAVGRGLHRQGGRVGDDPIAGGGIGQGRDLAGRRVPDGEAGGALHRHRGLRRGHQPHPQLRARRVGHRGRARVVEVEDLGAGAAERRRVARAVLGHADAVPVAVSGQPEGAVRGGGVVLHRARGPGGTEDGQRDGCGGDGEGGGDEQGDRPAHGDPSGGGATGTGPETHRPGSHDAASPAYHPNGGQRRRAATSAAQ